MKSVMFISTAALLFAPNQPDGDAAKKDIEQLKQGAWQIVAVDESSGEVAAPPEQRGITFRFTDDKIIIMGKGPVSPAIYNIDASKNPKQIEWTPEGTDLKIVGIYKFDRDTLIICASEKGPRPKDFKADKESRTAVVKFKRVKAKE